MNYVGNVAVKIVVTYSLHECVKPRPIYETLQLLKCT